MAKITPALLILILVTSLFGAFTLSSCSVDASSHELAMAPMDGMPSAVKNAPIVVQQAYQFAAANPDTMRQLPCYCGCGPIGHTSNYDCYVSETGADGSVKKFDEHALGCSICVDITQDAMRLLKEGESIADIRVYVDTNYAKFGPSNIP